MTTVNSGAVFFLGTRAHYQVLQQPETTRFDVENANSTETIYQNASVQCAKHSKELDNANYTRIIEGDWKCCDSDVNVTEENHIENGMRRRADRRPSETAFCGRDNDIKPSLLNNIEDSDKQKPKPSRRVALLQFLTSLSRRKRRLPDQIQYLRHLEEVLNTCTYRESCRCLECQSRYFECDESEGYSSDESEYAPAPPPYEPPPPPPAQPESDDDDEVFVDNVACDNTSTDLLITTGSLSADHQKMSVSTEASEAIDQDAEMDLGVAAGTPVLLNYLLSHPIACSIQ